MERSLLLYIIVFVSFVNVNAQQQLQNPGFEEWENVGLPIEEPVNWSSIKTSDGGSFINAAAPVVWGPSNDSHSGDYSIHLFNVDQYSIIVTGIITNGRVHSDYDPELGYVYTNPDTAQWHTPFTDRPDSVSIWFKYFPQSDDMLQVQVLLHVNEGSLPLIPEEEPNKIGYARMDIGGTHDTWTKFTAPFTYYSNDDPEYVLVIIAAGNGTTPVVGSEGFFDDIEMIYNPESISEKEEGEFNLYCYDNVIYLGELYKLLSKSSYLEVINLNGISLISTPITSDQILLSEEAIQEGIYIVRINSENQYYSQKLLIR